MTRARQPDPSPNFPTLAGLGDPFSTASSVGRLGAFKMNSWSSNVAIVVLTPNGTHGYVSPEVVYSPSHILLTAASLPDTREAA